MPSAEIDAALFAQAASFDTSKGENDEPSPHQECLGFRRPHQSRLPFLHANAFAEAGHEVQIVLLGEAVGLMRSCVANAVVPVGWPPLAETLTKTIELGTNIHV